MKGHVADADSCLNTGLSFNFSVRDSSLFHLIKAKVHKVSDYALFILPIVTI